VGAGVTANAVYKHFDSKSALLVATAKHTLELLPVDDDPALDSPERARAITRAFLVPEARPARRFVAELAVAAPRHSDLAQLMAQWNDERAAGGVAECHAGADGATGAAEAAAGDGSHRVAGHVEPGDRLVVPVEDLTC
jgi:AcrR family transcriptional regulator